MNRERLQTLRDHLASLPDERVDMRHLFTRPDGHEDMSTTAEMAMKECGTAACLAGWTLALYAPNDQWLDAHDAANELDLTGLQSQRLFTPDGYSNGLYTRTDAIAAIQSMLDSPDDDALPVWPGK